MVNDTGMVASETNACGSKLFWASGVKRACHTENSTQSLQASGPLTSDLLYWLAGNAAGQVLPLKILRPRAGILEVLHVLVTPTVH